MEPLAPCAWCLQGRSLLDTGSEQAGRSAAGSLAQVHRITESLRLEKTSQVIRSNCQPNTPMPAKLCPEVPHLQGF